MDRLVDQQKIICNKQFEETKKFIAVNAMNFSIIRMSELSIDHYQLPIDLWHYNKRLSNYFHQFEIEDKILARQWVICIQHH